MKIHHIGYLVKSIEKAIPSFEALGYHINVEPAFDEGRQAHICFMENGGYFVELIMPERESSLFPLLKQYGVSPYHICYTCKNLEQEIEKLQQKKFMLFKAPEKAPVISNTAKVAFLISARAGMIELLEE